MIMHYAVWAYNFLCYWILIYFDNLILCVSGETLYKVLVLMSNVLIKKLLLITLIYLLIIP